jgi:hypothetical protein
VDQVTVDVEKDRAAVFLADDVAVPKLVVERACKHAVAFESAG